METRNTLSGPILRSAVHVVVLAGHGHCHKNHLGLAVAVLHGGIILGVGAGGSLSLRANQAVFCSTATVPSTQSRVLYILFQQNLSRVFLSRGRRIESERPGLFSGVFANKQQEAFHGRSI